MGVAKVKDISGQRFGRLVVACLSGSGHHGEKVWECICDCGNKAYATGSSLRSGKTKSCGCLHSDWGKERMKKMKEDFPNPTKTHGDSRYKLYSIWCGMLQRCLNPKRDNYIYYGGRGITVCDRWRKYENFKDDMGQSYFEGASIDRIDVNGNYCPENCRWVKMRDQFSNRRNKIRVIMQGKEITVDEASKILGISKRTLYKHIRNGVVL